MKFPILSRSKPASNMDGALAAPATEDLPSSQSTSNIEIDKEQGEKQGIETTPIQEAEALDKLSDEPEYPTGAKLGIIVASLCLSVFLMALDNTIIATAIPKITDHFKALDDVGWYGSGESTTSSLRLHPHVLYLSIITDSATFLIKGY